MTKSHWDCRFAGEMEGEEVDEVGAAEVGFAEAEGVPWEHSSVVEELEDQRLQGQYLRHQHCLSPRLRALMELWRSRETPLWRERLK
jgi:hypothetical protein